ncbi:flagellar hook-length control protein FliK [Pseudobacteroides cellulosolvens]|uniref:Flagellar hook-length control protein-like protein n=1 Tax=Pseudobacteroides cellulosolvens ATCC 35603 = DSM 2933 TaxID=398512 RepID=A0A0L6JIY6_9FIRM|nr:flagellar hook-length control protein FliK [Pseudobacteroides cellulosolvens]KNY25417.1 Flagellar hook-length control protein-like protein [Pseudobacteroides cellulosolvens ATCC 35603 = DSM 2933]
MKVTHFNDSLLAGISNIDDVLSKLDVGDSLKARVIGISENELVLKLTDGSLLKAASMVPLDLKQGQLVDFIVKNKTDNQLFIETVKEGVQKAETDNIKTALLSMDVKPDDKSMDIANAIKSNNISLDKDTFNNIAQSLKFFKNLSPLKAAFLAANNLSIEEKNISALNSLLGNGTKIGKSLNSLNDIFESMDDIGLLVKIEVNLKKAGFNLEKQGDNSPLNDKSQDNLKGSILKEVTKLVDESTKASVNTSLKSILGKLTDDGVEGVSQLIKGSTDGDFESLSNKVKDFINKNISNIESSDKPFSDKLNTWLKDTSSINGKSNGIYNSTDEFVEDIKNLLEKIKNARAKNDSHEEGMSSSQSNTNEKEARHISKVLNSLFVRIDSDTLKDDLHAKNLYKDINSVLDIIRDTVSLSDNAMRDQLLNKTDSMQNMIRFINDLNSHSTFLQLPLKILDQNTNCEIYVLKKNGGKKRIDPGNATAYISLETTNIGKVDTLISMNKKNISVNMIVENDSVRDFVKISHNLLYKSLREKGYNLADLKCRVACEDINFINANSVMNKEIVKRGSIDFKI